LGRYDEAKAAVTDVPTEFVFLGDPLYNGSYGNNAWGPFGNFPVGDHEWGTGLGFVSEHDTVRVPVLYRRQGFNDTLVAEYAAAKYTAIDQPITLVSGVEARLIESEAALHTNDVSWLTILNALRTPVGLAPLADPGTDSARVDLVYHERAFWMYLTGRRLGDLRRLVRNYGRSAASVFPAAPNPLIPSAPYGSASSIAFSATDEGQFNPHITTGCMDQ